MNNYKVLKKQVYSKDKYSVVPLRIEDRYKIMRWRNEQIYHLRQSHILTEEDQDRYFQTIVAALFDQEQPNQILFSYLEGDICIGYGGLVHINWLDRHAEISFLIDTTLEEDFFKFHWRNYLCVIEEIAFKDLGLHKIFTYAFDLRPQLYQLLENRDFIKEAVLKQHVHFEDQFIDVVIHSKFAKSPLLRNAKSFDTELTFLWATNSDVRKYSFDNKKIEWEGHKNWYYNKIADTNCEYYILHDHGNNIGSIRFDIGRDGQALISYLIDPKYQGQGYGKFILDNGVQRLKDLREDVSSVFGFVLPENIASIKIFEKLGYHLTSKEVSLYRFDKTL